MTVQEKVVAPCGKQTESPAATNSRADAENPVENPTKKLYHKPKRQPKCRPVPITHLSPVVRHYLSGCLLALALPEDMTVSELMRKLDRGHNTERGWELWEAHLKKSKDWSLCWLKDLSDGMSAFIARRTVPSKGQVTA